MRKIILISLLQFFIIHSGRCQTSKGLYVDGFNSILGNSAKEDSLLRFAQYNGYNYLALYDLWPVHVTYNLTNASGCTVLANFIQNAKQNYGISQVGAVGENFFFFNNVIAIYNQQHSNAMQKFDVFNVEFEFWNTTSVSSGNYYCTTYLQPGGFSCDTAGAFAYYSILLHQVDSLANATGVISECYVGWFNAGQAITIGNSIDRILLHDYISSYSGLYSYVQTRLQYLAGRNVMTEVIPIFSAEPSFLGPWLSTHTDSLPYLDLQAALTNETGSWKQYIHLAGLQWFAYSFMPWNVVQTNAQKNIETEILFYPNPANEYLSIETGSTSETQVEIRNSLGEILVREIISGPERKQIELRSFPNGMYEVSLLKTDGKFQSGKLIITH